MVNSLKNTLYFKEIEKKWIKYWEENNTYKFIDDPKKEKFYILDMFPYPSGAGLHVGHLKGYLASDIFARYKRMLGFSVFHPIGWDSFGLPAEQYAIKTGNNPYDFTQKNISNFRAQTKRLLLSYDFNYEIDTSDPNYYKTTQWIFSKMYQNKLAVLKDSSVNWCEELNTVLSDEEILVIEGKKYSERGNFPIIPKVMKQWVLRITEYAEELLLGLSQLNWADNLKRIQKNWIGKNEKYQFKLFYKDECFFLNLRFASNISRLSAIGIHEFSLLTKLLEIDLISIGHKTALPYKLYNPFFKRYYDLYFLRDIDFREEELIPIFDLREEELVDLEEEKKFVSQYLDKGFKKVVVYRLKDWVFSRQRYWGEPIPILFDKDKNIFLEKNLPLILPKMNKYEKVGKFQSPLLNFPEWVNVDGGYIRETSTMPSWAGSSWYFLAFLLKKSDGKFYDFQDPEAQKILKRWMPVDLYIGGQEHATSHLLYSRFWYKFLHKLNLVPNSEPFAKLVNQGMVLASDGTKMSKSRGNSVNTNEIVEKYGADVLRCYEAFSGPVSLSFNWEEDGLKAMSKWLKKVFNFFLNLSNLNKVSNEDKELVLLEKRFLFNVFKAIEKMSINLGISECMIFINKLSELKKYTLNSLETFIKILSFYAPALSEEIWFNILKKSSSVFLSSLPDIDLNKSFEIKEIPLSINNKFKFLLIINDEDTEETIKKNALNRLKEEKLLEDKRVEKIIFIRNKAINLILK